LAILHSYVVTGPDEAVGQGLQLDAEVGQEIAYRGPQYETDKNLNVKLTKPSLHGSAPPVIRTLAAEQRAPHAEA
jgi:hypothetical protein